MSSPSIVEANVDDLGGTPTVLCLSTSFSTCVRSNGECPSGGGGECTATTRTRRSRLQ